MCARHTINSNYSLFSLFSLPFNIHWRKQRARESITCAVHVRIQLFTAHKYRERQETTHSSWSTWRLFSVDSIHFFCTKWKSYVNLNWNKTKGFFLLVDETKICLFGVSIQNLVFIPGKIYNLMRFSFNFRVWRTILNILKKIWSKCQE